MPAIPTTASKAVSSQQQTDSDSAKQLDRDQAAALLRCDLALLQRLAQSQYGDSLAADIRSALLTLIDPSGEASNWHDIDFSTCLSVRTQDTS